MARLVRWRRRHALGMEALMLRGFTMIRRLMRAARVLGAYGLLPPPEWKEFAPPGLSAIAFFFPQRKANMHGRSGERLSRALNELGPGYIKAGQFLATRPDVIGAEFARDLSELQDKLPPFSIAEAR